MSFDLIQENATHESVGIIVTLMPQAVVYGSQELMIFF